MSQSDRDSFVSQLESVCEAWMVKHAKAAFNGDVEAAHELYSALSNELRGTVAVAMWRTKVPVEAYRFFLQHAWDHDHQHVIHAAETHRRLSHMFRYADFPVPPTLPDVVTLWRGTSLVSIEVARMGYSWTTDRDVACWFAMRRGGQGKSPLVLTANVAKSHIALFHNGRSESEVVLMRAPTTAAIDGTSVDWVEGHNRVEASIRGKLTAFLERHKC